MAKPKSSRKYRPRSSARRQPAKRRSRSRAKLLLLGIALLGVTVVLIVLLTHRQPQAPPLPSPGPAPATIQVRPVTLTGLTTEQQVATLRAAATKLAEDLGARFPQEAEAHVLLGDVHRRCGRSTEAVACWQTALQIDPRRISAYDRIAIVAMEKGQFEEAITLWRQVLALDPASPGIHSKLGRMLMAQGQQDEAITALIEAVRLAPASAQTCYLLGQAHLQNKQYEQAVGYYQKAMELDPSLANAHYGLAQAYARLRQPALARQYQATFRKLSAPDPEDRPYGFSAEDDLSRARADYVSPALRGATLLKAKGHMAAAGALLRQASTVDPNDVACRKRLAAFYQGAGQLPQALAQCEHVARLEPNDPACQLLIGSLALRLNQPAKAEAAFRRVTVLAPGQSIGHRELARLYIRSKQRPAEARRLAEKAVALEPIAPNYFLLGQACDQSGDTKAALTAVSKAIQMDPRNNGYRQAYNMMKMRR